jgi:nitroreductase
MHAKAGIETQALREFGETLRGRRTIELFLHTPVPRELVRAAIEVATWAPNHRLTEPWQFHLLGKKAIDACIALVREMVTAKKNAAAGDFKAKSWAQKPGWLVVTCRKSDDKLLQQEDYGACAAAVQNLMLYLWKAGVGSKWTTGDITRDARFFDILGIDAAAVSVVGLIWYGYPKLTPTQQRKPLDEVLIELP